MSDHRANLGAMMVRGLQRFASSNGDNPINRWVEHPLSKLLMFVSVVLTGALVTLGVWTFLGLVAEVHANAAQLNKITTIVTESRGLIDGLERRLALIEILTFGRLAPRAGGEP